MAVSIDFGWTRGYSYELTPRTRPKAIRQTSRRKEPIRPLEIYSSIYADFAQLDGSPNACLTFASRWGLLRVPARDDAEEDLDFWRAEIRKMRSWIGALDRHYSTVNMASLDVAVSFTPFADPGATAALVLRPKSLLDAMVL